MMAANRRTPNGNRAGSIASRGLGSLNGWDEPATGREQPARETPRRTECSGCWLLCQGSVKHLGEDSES